MTVEERMEKARAKLVELFGPGGADKKGPLYDVAPEFGELAREVIFGAVWGDPALDTKTRSMITMAALSVMDKQPELRFHVRAALRLGIPRETIAAIICHLAFYGGVPNAYNSLKTVRDTFAEWDARHPRA